MCDGVIMYSASVLVNNEMYRCIQGESYSSTLLVRTRHFRSHTTAYNHTVRMSLGEAGPLGFGSQNIPIKISQDAGLPLR